MVLAKCPLNVKLERISTTLKYQRLENYAYLNLWGLWDFYNSVELTLVSWWGRHFLVERILINTHVLRDPFLVGIPLIMVGRRMQDISILRFLETTHATYVPRGSIKPSPLDPSTLGSPSIALLFRPVHKSVH